MIKRKYLPLCCKAPYDSLSAQKLLKTKRQKNDIFKANIIKLINYPLNSRKDIIPKGVKILLKRLKTTGFTRTFIREHWHVLEVKFTNDRKTKITINFEKLRE